MSSFYVNKTYKKLVQPAGVEPVRVASLEPESSASASSAMAAYVYDNGKSLPMYIFIISLG